MLAVASSTAGCFICVLASSFCCFLFVFGFVFDAPWFLPHLQKVNSQWIHQMRFINFVSPDR